MGKEITRGDLIRITINVNSGLLEQVDRYAESMHINRTSAISVLITQALDQIEMHGAIKKISEYLEGSEGEFIIEKGGKKLPKKQALN